MKREVANTPKTFWTSSIYWIVYTNIWVSLSVFCFTSFTFLFFDIDYSIRYTTLTGVTTLFAYNFQRLLKIPDYNEHKSDRHKWIENHRNTILLLTIISALVSLPLVFLLLTLKIIFYSTPFLLFVLLYAFSSTKVKALRELPFTKNIIISIVWTWVIAMLPFLIYKVAPTFQQYIYIGLVFLFVFALCIPFDIRDVKLDKGKVKTFATQFGIHKAKTISQFLLLIVGLVAFKFDIDEILYTSLLSFVAVRKTSAASSEIYFTGIIDGLFILIFLFYWVV